MSTTLIAWDVNDKITHKNNDSLLASMISSQTFTIHILKNENSKREFSAML